MEEDKNQFARSANEDKSKEGRCARWLTSAGGKEGEETFETNWDLEVNKFDDMGLKEEVLRGIYGYGFKDPSPIQQKAILPIIQGKDTIA